MRANDNLPLSPRDDFPRILTHAIVRDNLFL